MRSKKLLKTILTKLALQGVMLLYTFLLTKIIIDNFGSDVNGLISSITKFLAYISIFESGFGGVVQYLLYKPIAKKDNNTILRILKTSEKFFRKVGLIFVLYVIVLILFYPTIINTGFDSIFTASLIIIIALSTFAEYFFGAVYRVYLLARQEKYVISIIQIATYILNVVVILVASSLIRDVRVLELVLCLVFMLRPLLQSLYVKKKYHIHLEGIKGDYMISQKWDAFAQHIASIIHRNTDVTVLTVFCTLTDVSIYAVYYMIVSGVTSLMSSIIDGFDSLFGDIVAKDESDNLKKKFKMTEVVFLMLNSVFFSLAMVLIMPFVKLYIANNDVNYINYVFGMLLVIGEYIYSIRLPYNSLVKSVGHYKETRVGAWVEAIVNIVISCILVSWLGLVGVAIGTVVAMIVRTVEYIIHVNRFVLKRSSFETFKVVTIDLLGLIISILVLGWIIPMNMSGFGQWIGLGCLAALVAVAILLLLNAIFYKDEVRSFFDLTKRILKRKRL